MDKYITRAAVMEVLREYWQQYKIHPWYSAIAFLVPAAGSIFVSYIPPLAVAQIINIFSQKGSISLEVIWPHILIFGGSWLLGEVLWRVGMHFLIKLETAGLARLGKLAYKRLIERDYDFYTNNFVGTLTNKASAFQRGFEGFTDTLSYNILSSIFPFIFAVIILWQYSPIIPIVLLVSIVVTITILLPIIRRRAKLISARHDMGSRVAGRLSDSLTNILAIKSFAHESAEYKKFGEYVDEYTLRHKKAADFQNLRSDMVASPLYVITNVFGLVAAIFFAQKLALSVGAILVVFSYYSVITRIFFDFNRIYRNIEASISGAAEFTQLLIAPAKVNDMENAQALKVTEAVVRFEHAGFGYDKQGGDQIKFLDQFNLEIKGNQKVGLVGPSGGGKTTLTKLLLRFIDLQSGAITIDSQDISKVTQSSLRSNLAYVPQEPLLFHRSLFENIAYGKENATEEEVMKAAKLARAHEFIEKLPQGYKTLVGERGIKLSGGQRQRVAIARAILKNAPILILDEATSSLDSESEKFIQEGLWELMKDKTALVIAHRLSTIKHLDRIIVLDDGKIVQDGTHDELIRKPGLYATLWSHQSGEFLAE
ncbi:MAG: ABC transporter ATP-binding protein [Patescibacteria group bacterium]